MMVLIRIDEYDYKEEEEMELVMMVMDFLMIIVKNIIKERRIRYEER